MENNKVKFLTYAVVFLAVLNITTFITIGYHLKQSKSEIQSNSNAAIEGNSEAFTGRYFRDRLQLSKTQMNQFREINAEFRTQARSINLELINQRRLMLEEMTQQATSETLLNSYADTIGNLHKDLKSITFKYYLGIKGICNEQQKVELNQIFNEFFINDLHMGNKKMNGGQRHGQNRNFNRN